MVIVIPKDFIKSQNLTSRNAASFGACVGANASERIVTVRWTTKKRERPRRRSVDGTGGVAPTARSSPTPANPCVDPKTKQVADVQAYLGSGASTCPRS